MSKKAYYFEVGEEDIEGLNRDVPYYGIPYKTMDDNLGMCQTFDEAFGYVNRFIKNGVNLTYGIIVEVDVDDEDFDNIYNGWSDAYDYSYMKTGKLKYSAYKNENGEYITAYDDTTDMKLPENKKVTECGNKQRRVLGEHVVIEDKECLKEDTLTWDEIMTNAEGTTFGQRALKVKDQARAEVEELMQKDGINIDNLENVEDEIEKYVTDHNIRFASNGCIIDNIKENKELLVEDDDLLGLKNYADELKTYIGVNKNRPEMQTRQKELDSIIEKLWVALEDVPFVEDKNRELILDGEYLDFPKGTTRDKIWHWFDDMYSKGVAYLINDFDITTHRATENKKITEDADEDLDEAFYEKICRAYIDTVNLEWVTTNPENYDSVVHGYFPDDEEAKKWGYGSKITPDNFKEFISFTDDEIENDDYDRAMYYEYETWEDFYEDYVKDEIEYDINDIGVYSDGSTDYDEGINHWDFYISEEDLTKLGLWNEDVKSEFLDESKKVTEAEQYYDLYITYDDNSTGYIRTSAKGAGNIVAIDIPRIKRIDVDNGGINHDLDESKKVESLSLDNIMDYRELIDGDTGDLVDTFFFDHKITEEEDKAIADAINKAKSEVEDYDNYTIMEYINKIVPIKQSLSAIYSDLGPSTKKQIKY